MQGMNMQGVNQVVVAGYLNQAALMTKTDAEKDILKFTIVVERVTEINTIIRAYVKANIYNSDLIKGSRDALLKGAYVIAVGELMSWRSSDGRDNMEVRVRDIRIFP